MQKYLSKEFFDFFKKLAANNHKDWFDANRKAYEQDVKAPFEKLVDALIFELAKIDDRFSQIKNKDCIFRINRDIRFAKDKTPYKLNRSAAIAPGGKKDFNPIGFYFEVGPGGCTFYSGVYMADKDQLALARNYIAKHNSELNKIIENKDFKKYFGEVLGEKQKRLGPDLQAAGAIQPLIYNAQFYLKHEFSQKLALDENFVPELIAIWKKSLPFGKYFSEALHKTKEANQ